ncbi:protein PLASTID MOVEMENT IMPAIRED 1-like [Aristolochia californica]|uniref:protein PLASTID MOVEMENT IMPAIRED 1-like n=1 Tax=Aristolochia californica TaxID=171875 RepID=UPI0035D9A673
MANPNQERRNSNTQVLEELEALSQSLYQTHTARRTASLVLPRSAAVEISDASAGAKPEAKPLLRRLSLSPWRSRPETQKPDDRAVPQKPAGKKFDASSATEKKGIWNWKPIRALSHIGMHRMSCLFSVEVVAVQGLPSSMNGLRLAVCVRKKETKEGAVQTMPSRVLQGAADFEETLFINCHVYCSGGRAEKVIKFDPRPFLIFVKAVDAVELDFGRSLVDLSALVQESMEKNLEGTRIRQWDTSFDLIGKAKGGELVLKLGFQIIEDKGVGIYRQGESLKSSKTKDSSSSSYARKQSKTSFSVTSPRITSRSSEAHTPSKSGRSTNLQGMDELNLDEPAPALIPSSYVDQKSEQQAKAEELELPEFDVVDKGVEFQEGEEEGKTDVDSDAEPKEAIDEQFISSEVVKEVVLDQGHQRRLTELDSIAKQIKALESMIQIDNLVKNEQDTDVQRLDAEEETVTREFLQMLEEEEIIDQFKLTLPEIPPFKLEGAEEVIARGSESESKVFVPDLGKGIGSVVQTRDGGYLASMNPLNIEVPRKETPKLAMQISKPLLLSTTDSGSGFELFQKMAGVGTEELSSRILSLAAMDDLTGKTAEQVAFEGIASAIIHGRNKEVASSSAARSIAAVRGMVAALSAGRKERLDTGIWNVSENQVPLDEILSFSLQKIESTVLEGLKIQADMSDRDPPFDVSPAAGPPGPLDSVRPFHDWLKDGADAPESVTMMVVVQLRDPLRRYEAVGGPMVVLLQAARAEGEMVKVGSLSVGGAKGRHVLDGERRRLTAMQWLVAYGLGKAGKKGKHVQRKGGDMPALWSVSARVMADLWLKPIRNPDVRLAK